MEKRILYVTNNNDKGEGTLRDAINKANKFKEGTTNIIIKNIDDNIIKIKSPFIITSNITLRNETENKLIIKAIDKTNIFYIREEPSVRLYTFKIESQYPIKLSKGKSKTNGGAILVDSPHHELILENVKLSKNKAVDSGGSIYSKGNITIISGKLNSNEAGIQGGAIWCDKNLVLKDCLVKNNKITTIKTKCGGAGIYCNNGNCVINDSIIEHNSVEYNPKKLTGGSGGGIILMTGSLNIQNSNISYNTALNSAGIQMGSGNIIVYDSKINYNESFNISPSPGGGGVTMTNGTIYFSNTEISYNKTQGMYSAGIVSLVGDVVLNNCIITNNVNNGPGGGVALNIGSLTMTDTIISDNTGSSLGGAIVNFMPNPGTITIVSSKILNNTLTNFQTIQGTINSFIQVVTENTSATSSQATKSGNTQLKKIIESVLQKLRANFEFLKIIQLKLTTSNLIGGGAIACLTETPVFISNSEIKGNFAGEKISNKNVPFDAYGGAIFALNSNINIKNTIITENKAYTNGGGIWNGFNLTVNDSKITKNSVINGNGGGIVTLGQAILINTKVSENHASKYGGGIINEGRLELVSSLISNNVGELGNNQIIGDYINVDSIVK